MQRDVLTAQLVGVGEAAHGELMSWATRIRLLNAALRRHAQPVVVFTEQAHPLVAAMNAPGGFELHPPEFVPHLLPFAQLSAEHLAIHRRLRRLSAAGRVVFVGVDVAAGCFPELWRAGLLPGGDARTDAIVRAAIDRHSRGFKRGDGTARNQRNAAVILDLMRELPRAPMYFYWAHNGHVAYDHLKPERDRHYQLEGELLRRALPPGAYRAVLTYSPGPVWSFWGDVKKQRRALEPSRAARLFFKERPTTMRMSSLPEGLVLNRLFRASDADWVVVVATSPRMTPLAA